MRELFLKYLRNQCTPGEVNLLLKQFDIEENKDILSSLIAQQLKAEPDLAPVDEIEHENFLVYTYQKIKRRIFFEVRFAILPVIFELFFMTKC